MRVLNSFLLLLVVAVLWMLPASEAIYDFRTDVREDDFDVTTAVAQTTANCTLVKPIYDDDYQTISILSDLSTDNATFVSYNSTTRVVNISNLEADADRTLTISYDINAFTDNSVWNTFIDMVPIIWILILVCFPILGLVATWWRRF